MARVHSGRGVDRLVNFSDATVAIAITLLVLPLVDVAAQFGDGEEPAAILRENSAAFLAFAISFAVIGRLWISHHGVFERVDDYSPALIRVNFVWLASIVFLPFATNALAAVSGEHKDVVYGLYIGTILVSCLALVLIERTLQRDPALAPDRGDDPIDLTDGLVTAALLLAALVVAVTVPAIGIWALLLLLASAPITRFVSSRRARRRVPAVPGPDVGGAS